MEPTKTSFLRSRLFKDVQQSGLFTDSKIFCDVTLKPQVELQKALEDYEKQDEDVDLMDFIGKYFDLPREQVIDAPGKDTLLNYINALWSVLTRLDKASSQVLTKILLPHPYVVPGGRFRELYYWDSYFTIKGLLVTGESKLAQSMVDNFTVLIEKHGFIPNGARTYYLSRSQPPLYSLMLNDVFVEMNRPLENRYLAAVLREYSFWMDGESLVEKNKAYKRVVKIGNCLLNRYWDESNTPRPESFTEDLELAQELSTDSSQNFYRNIRAACESGWDFSSRWCENPTDLRSIRTTDIIPIDLNCHLFLMEELLSKRLAEINRKQEADEFSKKSLARKQAIQELLYCAEDKCFYDRIISSNELHRFLHAGIFQPMFAGIATDEQGTALKTILSEKFMMKGGLVTTPYKFLKGQQWDYPNGWAPLQYFAYMGLKKYGFDTVALELARSFLECVKNDLDITGTIKEKYDVVSPNQLAKGGEYNVQIGFGWTNGVAAYFDKEINSIETNKKA